MLTHPDHKGWESITKDEGRHVHTVPFLDVVDHDINDEGDCACGPEIEPVATKSGDMHYCIHHHSLDGREQRE